MIQPESQKTINNRVRAGVKVVKKEQLAEGTLGLYLEKPAGFFYSAGQYALLNIPSLNEKGGRESTHSMSLASAPYQDYLFFAMRISQSDFKQTICKMAIGEELVVDGPIGNLFLTQDARPVVFIAGGIGIAPFFGIIQEQIHLGWSRPITLFYGNKFPQNSAFLETLQGIKNDHFSFIPVMSQLPDEDKTWLGERGRVSATLISKYVKDVHAPIYYIVGLPEMVRATKEELLKLNVLPENIKIEFFSGYQKTN